MSLYQLLFEPFFANDNMRRALASCLALSLGGAPIGVLLVLRRMSLMGDVMSHAILPGVAIAFVLAGLSLPAMSLGGLIAGLVVALLAGVVSRVTALREETSLAGFYLTSLALGVLIISSRGSDEELVHVLFGDIRTVNAASLALMAMVASLTLATLALIYRPLMVECFDPGFLRTVSGGGTVYHGIFLTLVVLNMVAGFQALGSLLSVGLMILPAASARLWARHVWGLVLVAVLVAFVSGAIGLLAAHHLGTAPGPSIILVAGLAYLCSIVLGRHGGIMRRYFPPPHYHAGPKV